MLREVVKIFIRAFRMIFQYPIFIYVPAIYYFYSLVFYFAQNYLSLSFLAFWRVIDLAINTVFSFGVPIVFILIVLQEANPIEMRTVIREARGLFWKYIGQNFVGLALVFLFSLPFICLYLFIFTTNEGPFIASIFWFWVIGFISVGPVTLGLRFLVDSRNGVFKNSMDGFRMLNGHLLFFFILYGVETFISGLGYSLRLFIGSIFTGLDFVILSFSSIQEYLKSVSVFNEAPAVYIYNAIVGTILYSLYIIVPTLAYVRCKNHASLARAVQQSAPTDN